MTLAGDSMPNDKIGIGPRFAIEIKGIQAATFSECSGIVATMRTDKLEEGGVNGTTLKFPGRTDFGNVTLKHGVTHSTDLFDWFEKIVEGEKDRRDIAVQVFDPGDSSESPLLTWWLINAFPVKWTAPSLQTSSNAIALEAVEFALEGVKKG